MTPRFTIGDCAGGHRADNRVKNRNVLCVPRKYLCHTRCSCLYLNYSLFHICVCWFALVSFLMVYHVMNFVSWLDVCYFCNSRFILFHILISWFIPFSFFFISSLFIGVICSTHVLVCCTVSSACHGFLFFFHISHYFLVSYI